MQVLKDHNNWSRLSTKAEEITYGRKERRLIAERLVMIVTGQENGHGKRRFFCARIALEQLVPGAVGWRVRQVVAAAVQHQTPLRLGLPPEPLDQRGLTDTGRAADEDERAMTIEHRIECLTQRRLFPLAPDEAGSLT